MQIKELVKATGASARSLRHYEKQGLLTARRSQNGYRRYSEDAVRTVAHIQWLLSAGLTTAKICQILPCLLEEKPGLITCPALRKQLQSEIERLQQRIIDFEISRDLLRAVLTETPNSESSRDSARTHERTLKERRLALRH